jgi:DNA invertase Pin-like site-specific DNA recombinase
MARRMQVQPDGTRELRKAARAVRTAEAKLATAILEAHMSGSSLRTIAIATGHSHETVRAILAKEQRRVASLEARLARPIAALTLDDTAREEAARRRLARALPVKKPDA